MKSAAETTSDEFRILPVTPERWGDLVELFERPGPRGGLPIPGSCWCQAYRGNPPEVAVRKRSMRQLVESGAVPGLLAYSDERPVGWVAVAVRDGYVGIGRSRTLRPSEEEPDVYAITCFYVDPAARAGGLSSALLDAAIDWAIERGAVAIEGYPKQSAAPHARNSASDEQRFSFMGRLEMFERRGFDACRDAGARVVVRRQVRN